MFTGLVEIMGRIRSIEPMDSTLSGGGGFSMVIEKAGAILDDCKLGDSIAVNGVCLTVTEFDAAEGWFKVGISPETLRKTNLSDYKVNDLVDLERALSGGARYGGHFVQGHVDTTVTIAEIIADPPNSIIFKFAVAKPTEDGHDYLSYIIPKGYVALEGASLTVVNVDWTTRQFSVMLIAYTQSKIVLPIKKVGDRVNLEVDQVGKYVENMVRGMLASENGPMAALIENAVKRVLNTK